MMIAFLFIVAIGSSIINSVLNLIFGFFHRIFGRNGQSAHHAHQSSHHSRQSASESHARQSKAADGKRREKIFDKSDGEYVDFEEIEE